MYGESTDMDKPLTNEEIYRRKAAQRKKFAKATIESKLQNLVRLQQIAYAMAKSSGREASRPWRPPVKTDN
jgi:hypothetical protein